MKAGNKISALQFFITLFLCSVPVSFGIFKTGAEKNSLLINIIISAAGAVLLILAFLPSYLLNLKTDMDLFSITREKSPALSLYLKIFYTLCYLIFTCAFLAEFARFMQTQINRDAAAAVVSAVFLLIAAFSCYKGFQPLFRAALIILAFVLFALAFIFFGLIEKTVPSSITASPLSVYSQLSGGIGALSVLLLPLSSYPVFADRIKGNHKKGIVLFSLSAMSLFLLAGFFVSFVLGEFSAVNEYPAFIISKLSQLSVLKGGDGLLFASLTAVTFLAVCLFFACSAKTTGASHSRPFSTGFALAAYILTLLACYIPAVYDFITNTAFLAVLAVLAEAVIPLSALFYVNKEVN